MPIDKDRKIPAFLDKYHLPPGIHECRLDDFRARFAETSKRRKVIWLVFLKFLDELKKNNMEPSSVILDGSYVTGRRNPGDLDCIFIIDPDKVKKALNEQGQGARELVAIMSVPHKRSSFEAEFGVQAFLAESEQRCSDLTNLFRYGRFGEGLRDPDPKRDPNWVTKPYEKGILKVIIDNSDEEGE